MRGGTLDRGPVVNDGNRNEVCRANAPRPRVPRRALFRDAGRDRREVMWSATFQRVRAASNARSRRLRGVRRSPSWLDDRSTRDRSRRDRDAKQPSSHSRGGRGSLAGYCLARDSARGDAVRGGARHGCVHRIRSARPTTRRILGPARSGSGTRDPVDSARRSPSRRASVHQRRSTPRGPRSSRSIENKPAVGSRAGDRHRSRRQQGTASCARRARPVSRRGCARGARALVSHRSERADRARGDCGAPGRPASFVRTPRSRDAMACCPKCSGCSRRTTAERGRPRGVVHGSRREAFRREAFPWTR